MTYTALALAGVVAVVLVDLFVLRTRMVTRKGFWTAYAIIAFFQLLTNAVWTGLEVVTYNPDVILGGEEPQLLGGWRIAFAPVEDLLFGFALVTLTLSTWIWWGRRGVNR